MDLELRPFGTDAANVNPAEPGTFAYNLRFPDQLFDEQGGLHQNVLSTLLMDFL